MTMIDHIIVRKDGTGIIYSQHIWAIICVPMVTAEFAASFIIFHSLDMNIIPVHTMMLNC